MKGLKTRAKAQEYNNELDADGHGQQMTADDSSTWSSFQTNPVLDWFPWPNSHGGFARACSRRLRPFDRQMAHERLLKDASERWETQDFPRSRVRVVLV